VTAPADAEGTRVAAVNAAARGGPRTASVEDVMERKWESAAWGRGGGGGLAGVRVEEAPTSTRDAAQGVLASPEPWHKEDSRSHTSDHS
jgi:hypothetical protein